MAETVNTYEQPTPESQEHVDAMVAKAENAEQGGSTDRPEWLPDKFKSAEDMAKAYSELESKLGQPQNQETSDKEQTDALEEQVNQNASEVSELLDSKGLDFSVFQEEYMETGELSPEAYQALEESGLSRTLVDTWIQGQDALAGQITSEIHELAGGEGQYQALMDWAGDNLPPAEIEAFNATMDRMDANEVRFAVQGLYARYRSEAEPNLVQAGTGAVSGGKFSSNAELTEAMRDPRYAKDPAYRQEIANKLARSSLF
jgi:hypothetical protein